MLAFVDPIGRLLTDGFHILALFAIGGATVWAAAAAFHAMVEKGAVTIEDLLLLFIYLEIGSMVGIYFRTNHMPVRFLLYVGITALTRHLIGFVQHEEIADMGVLILASAILILAFAVLVIRFTSNRFPSPTDDELARGEVSRGAIGAKNKGTADMRLDLIVRNATLPDGRRDRTLRSPTAASSRSSAEFEGEARETIDARRLSSRAAFRRLPFSHGRDAVARPAAPQFSGTLLEGIALWGELKPLLTHEAVVERALRYCDLAVVARPARGAQPRRRLRRPAARGRGAARRASDG